MRFLRLIWRSPEILLCRDGVEGKINGEQKNAQQATSEVVEEFAAIFDAMDDDYMRERAADIKDIGKRLMAALKGVKRPDLGGLTEPVVVVRAICILPIR